MICLCALVAIAACVRGGDDTSGDLAREGNAKTTTSWGTYVVQVRAISAPIAVGVPFSLEVRVTPAPASDDAAIAVDAGMPSHGHGMNLVPRTHRTDGERFTVDGMLLHMPGAWELYVDVTSAGETERATFAFTVEG